MYATAFLDLPPLNAAEGTVTLPGSKSISNRVLLLSALCEGTTVVHDLLDSDDTRVMLAALRQLGCGVAVAGTTVTIEGLGGRAWPAQAIEFFMGNAGTAMRPLTAALAVQGGDFVLKGVPRMHERPIGDLVDALRELGCSIDYLGNPGYPPLRVGRPQLQLDKPIPVRGDVSSQFLTALLMALPLAAAQRAITIEVVGELISKPYIEITLNLLARYGISVQREGWQRFVIPARWGRLRREQAFGFKGWAPIRFRAIFASWTLPRKWARPLRVARTGWRCAGAPGHSRASRSTPMRFPTRP